ncbi:MAG: flagellar basal body-associated FliL family protein [Hyphomicrobiales bacterium]|nr:flagellar basal body-associated FliL family protein [Hyphomicrobiales bacterium]
MFGKIIPFILAAVLSVGVGGAYGWFAPRPKQEAAAQCQPAEQAAEAAPAGVVREMKPIIVNLAAPPGAWVRLEAAVAFKADAKKIDDVVVHELGNDFAAFLRSLSASDLEGPQGLARLKDDLFDRATIRSDKKAREVLIETLVVQ